MDLLSLLCRDPHSLRDGPLRSRESFLESFCQQRKDIFPDLGHLTMLFQRALPECA